MRFVVVCPACGYEWECKGATGVTTCGQCHKHFTIPRATMRAAGWVRSDSERAADRARRARRVEAAGGTYRPYRPKVKAAWAPAEATRPLPPVRTAPEIEIAPRRASQEPPAAVSVDLGEAVASMLANLGMGTQPAQPAPPARQVPAQPPRRAVRPRATQPTPTTTGRRAGAVKPCPSVGPVGPCRETKGHPGRHHGNGMAWA